VRRRAVSVESDPSGLARASGIADAFEDGDDKRVRSVLERIRVALNAKPKHVDYSDSVSRKFSLDAVVAWVSTAYPESRHHFRSWDGRQIMLNLSGSASAGIGLRRHRRPDYVTREYTRAFLLGAATTRHRSNVTRHIGAVARLGG
jgi:hypothetical protein